MFAKLCTLVVVIGAYGCALLAMRQSRLQAASELAQTQIRIAAQDKRLWDLRARIAERTTPTAIEEMAASVSRLRPMVPEAIEAEPRTASAP